MSYVETSTAHQSPCQLSAVFNCLGYFFQELMDTVTEFMKLEKIEFGGIKGKMLSAQVVGMFEEFTELYKVFTEQSYDALDPTDEVR